MTTLVGLLKSVLGPQPASSSSALVPAFTFPKFSEAITQFIHAPWEPGESPPSLFSLIGEMHVDRFKEEGDLAACAKKARKVWNDVVDRVGLAARLLEQRSLDGEEEKFLKLQLIPLSKTPISYARDWGFPKKLIPELQEGFKMLCQILSGEIPYPETDRERLRFELFLLRRMALTTLTKERGDLLDYNWLDLLRDYKERGVREAEEANRVLVHLRLIDETYDHFFKQQILHKDTSPITGGPQLPVIVQGGFPRFVNEMRMESLSCFSLKFPPCGLELLDRYLFQSVDEENQNAVLYFFREAEKQIGKNCVKSDYTKPYNSLLNLLGRIFDPKSRLKNLLASALLYTATFPILLSKGYPKLQKGWEALFFTSCVQLSWEDRKNLFEKLFTLDPAVVKASEAWEAQLFLVLGGKSWLTPYHLLWVFFHEMELVHTGQRKGDKLTALEVVELVEEIHQFLGIPLCSESIWALFGGVPLGSEAKIAMKNLKAWRGEIKDEIREFLPSYLQMDLLRRREELNRAFADTTPLQSLKDNLAELLWFSTYLPPLHLAEFKHLPLRLQEEDKVVKLVFESNRAVMTVPQGIWHGPTTHFGRGPHLRASWKNLTPNKRSGGSYRFEWVYTPDFRTQQTFSESFFLEIDEKQGCDLMTREIFRTFLFDYSIQKNRETHVEVCIYRALYPEQYDKLNHFLKQLNLSVRNLPMRMTEPFPDLKDQPIDVFIRQRRTFPLLDQKAISILPPSHPLAADSAYCILREHYTGFAELVVQQMKNLYQNEVKMTFEDREIGVTICVEESSFDPKFFILTASTTLKDVRYEDKMGFPHTCANELKVEMILGLLIQFKGLLYRERITANATYSQSVSESKAT